MSRIEHSGMSTLNWAQNNLAQVKSHKAWFNDIKDDKGAEEKLKGSQPNTYLLRSGKGESSYYMSYVRPDGSIYHQEFELIKDPSKWYFKNGFATAREVIADDLNDLIAQVMLCKHYECNALTN